MININHPPEGNLTLQFENGKTRFQVVIILSELV